MNVKHDRDTQVCDDLGAVDCGYYHNTNTQENAMRAMLMSGWDDDEMDSGADDWDNGLDDELDEDWDSDDWGSSQYDSDDYENPDSEYYGE